MCGLKIVTKEESERPKKRKIEGEIGRVQKVIYVHRLRPRVVFRVMTFIVLVPSDNKLNFLLSIFCGAS